MSKRLLLASCGAEPGTVSSPDMKKLLFNDSMGHLGIMLNSSNKYSFKFVTNLSCIRKLNLKANGIIKKIFYLWSWQNMFQIHFLLNIFSYFTIICKRYIFVYVFVICTKINIYTYIITYVHILAIPLL